MPAVYEKLGIRFLYPDNWQLDEGDALQGNPSVSVYSPQGAFWSVTVHDLEDDPAELATAALQVLQAEYQDGEVAEVSEQIGPHLIRGYDMNFFCLDFTNTALIRGFHSDGATCLVLCQAEDREFEAVAPVFRAMTTSLLTRCGNQADPAND